MNEDSTSGSLVSKTIAALLIGAAFAISLVLLSYVVEGLQPATRTLTDLAMPIGVLWLGMFTAATWFALRRIWSASIAFAIGFFFIAVTANTYLSSRFVHWVEWPEQKPQATPENPYQTVVVLGGATTITADHTAELYRDGERVFSAVQLWHAGLVASITCTGSASDGVANPRDIASELLQSAGVPAEVIFKVPGENTSQEMAGMKKFLANPPEDFPAAGKIALLTSALHMQRAMRLAKTQGLDLEPLPCAYRSGYFPNFSPRAFVPKAYAASSFGDAIKEVVAGLFGR